MKKNTNINYIDSGFITQTLLYPCNSYQPSVFSKCFAVMGMALNKFKRDTLSMDIISTLNGRFINLFENSFIFDIISGRSLTIACEFVYVAFVPLLHRTRTYSMEYGRAIVLLKSIQCDRLFC